MPVTSALLCDTHSLKNRNLKASSAPPKWPEKSKFVLFRFVLIIPIVLGAMINKPPSF